MDGLKRRSTVGGALLLFMVMVTPVWSADMMLLIPGIEGQSQFFPGGITVDSYSHGVQNSGDGTGGGGGAGVATFSALKVRKPVGKETPVLYEHCASGRHIEKLTLFVRQGTGEGDGRYYIITLEDVVVASCETESSPGGLGTETVTFLYGKIQTEVSGLRNDMGQPLGPVRFSWDLKVNRSE